MNKDELRIRIIPEDGQILIETHTDGIVKCKEVQEDALLDCIKNSARCEIMSTVDCCRQIVSMSKSIRTGTRNIVSGTRTYTQTSAIMRRHIRTFRCQDWSLRSMLAQKVRSADAGWALSRTKDRRWRP